MIYFAQAQNTNESGKRIKSLITALQERKCISLFIEVASTCNLKCEFCGFQRDIHTKKKGIMTAGTVETLCTVLKNTGLTFQNFNFYNHGEPLCNKNLAGIVRKVAGTFGAETYKIVTNGVLLSPDRLIELIDSGINSIKVSLDVGKKKRFIALKGIDAFDIVYQNICFAIDYISKNSLDVNFVIKTCIPMTGGVISSDDMEDVLTLFESKCKKSANIHIEIVQEYRWHCDGEDSYGSCEAPFTQCVVNFDGVISACCADTEYALEIGNLSECDSLDEVIYGQKMRRIRKSMLGAAKNIPPHCRHCGVRTCVNIEDCRKDIVPLI
jgi:sulfatase maturation enzyme AslB (radical SAM superfamily)